MKASPAHFYDSYYNEVRERLRDASPELLETICTTFLEARGTNRKIIVAGNGGSAAIASHVSVDLTKTTGIRSICFNEADLITCYANDYGYENWLAMAFESYAAAADIAVLISSSGRSPNIINAARRARDLNLCVVTLSGFDRDNPLHVLGHHNLWVNSRSYNIVEATHQTWLLACIDRIAGQLDTNQSS